MKPVSREGYKFRQDICVPCYQTNRNADMRPAAVMDLAQELANVSADSLGFGFDDLQRYGMAWVLSRMHIEFRSLPRWKALEKPSPISKPFAALMPSIA